MAGVLMRPGGGAPMSKQDAEKFVKKFDDSTGTEAERAASALAQGGESLRSPRTSPHTAVLTPSSPPLRSRRTTNRASRPMMAGQLRKGMRRVIKGRPCEVTDISTSKTGKHGHAKCLIKATDIFTGKQLEDMVPASHNAEVRIRRGGGRGDVLGIDEDEGGPLLDRRRGHDNDQGS